MYFGSYVLQKPWLDKCLKGPVSEHPSIRNMVRETKHEWYYFYHIC